MRECMTQQFLSQSRRAFRGNSDLLQENATQSEAKKGKSGIVSNLRASSLSRQRLRKVLANKQTVLPDEETILIEPRIIHHFIGAIDRRATAHERNEGLLDLAALAAGVVRTGFITFIRTDSD